MFKGLKPIIYNGQEVWPLVEGGKGVAATNHASAGAWAAAGGIGTVSAVNADSYDAEGKIIPQVYKALTRRERHEELIAYAIEAAAQSGLFEHIVVSTDDQEIAKLALELKAEVPFVRPQELADDHTPTVPVIAHAIQECAALGWAADEVCCIYPAVPFLLPQDLKSAFELFDASDAAFCFPVTEFPSAIQRALRRSPDGRVAPMNPEYELTRTQDLEPAYHDAGQFYWSSARFWQEKQRVHSNAVGHLTPSWRVVDIDTPDDWLRAEALYQAALRIK